MGTGIRLSSGYPIIWGKGTVLGRTRYKNFNYFRRKFKWSEVLGLEPNVHILGGMGMEGERRSKTSKDLFFFHGTLLGGTSVSQS